MPIDLLVLIAGALVAGVVQGISGFAFSMVAMSIWVWALEPHLAAVMAVLGSLVGQVVAMGSVRRRFDLAELAPWLGGAVLGVPLGILVLPWLNADLFKLLLGALLVVGCPALMLAARLPKVGGGGRIGNALAGGAGGFMGGIGGFTGVIPTLWCTVQGMDKDRQRATVQNFNLATLSFTLAGYIASGTITRPMLAQLPVLVAAVAPAAWFGGRLYVGMSQDAFRRFVLSLLALAGAAMLAAAVPRLLA